MDEMKHLNETLHFIRSHTPTSPKIGLILGSGLASFGEQVTTEIKIPFKDLPHFPPPTVDGHPGQLIIGQVGSQSIAILQGRVHYYEGLSPQQVVFPTRMLKALGVEILILTNAAGGLNTKMRPGDFMVLTDHINLTGYNPLRGPNHNELGPRFPDMTQTYSPQLRERLLQQLAKQNIPHHEGVYVGLSGPSYETPAEIRFLQIIGGDAVGMSTVPEAIVAKHMDMKIVGISCITNMGAGISATSLSHQDVKDVGQKVEHTFAQFLSQFVESL